MNTSIVEDILHPTTTDEDLESAAGEMALSFSAVTSRSYGCCS